jgi:putative oxidoreductase
LRRLVGLKTAVENEMEASEMNERLTPWSPYALAVLRIMTALLFIQHGTQKFFAFPPSEYFPEAPAVFSLMGVAGLLELIGGALILIGLLTRPVAFVLSGFMAAAYFMGHAPQGFFPASTGGESAIFFCFIFLYMVFAGAGAWSLDAMRSGSLTTAKA